MRSAPASVAPPVPSVLPTSSVPSGQRVLPTHACRPLADPVGAQAHGTARLAAIGSIAGLAILKVVMLAALFTETPPYPPPAFAPLFAASLALSALAVALIYGGSRWFLAPTALVVLESLLSVGPHKLYPGESSFFAQSAAVYPVILVGTALILVLIGSSRTLVAASQAGASAGPIASAVVPS